MNYLLISLLLWFMQLTEPKPTKIEVKGSFEPVAVIELFTSQGCSSCPSADALLNRTIKENKLLKIFGLSFHINYWNHLGWIDPHSKEEFTKRQYWYENKLKGGVYTPQAIINGTNEFVGSNKIAFSKNINVALAKPSIIAINLTFVEQKLSYSLGGNYKNTIINIAMVQNEAYDFIKKGENEGRKLVHNNVILSLETFKAEANGQVKIKPLENASKLIVFAQNTITGAVVGASEIAIL